MSTVVKSIPHFMQTSDRKFCFERLSHSELQKLLNEKDPSKMRLPSCFYEKRCSSHNWCTYISSTVQGKYPGYFIGIFYENRKDGNGVFVSFADNKNCFHLVDCKHNIDSYLNFSLLAVTFANMFNSFYDLRDDRAFNILVNSAVKNNGKKAHPHCWVGPDDGGLHDPVFTGIIQSLNLRLNTRGKKRTAQPFDDDVVDTISIREFFSSFNVVDKLLGGKDQALKGEFYIFIYLNKRTVSVSRPRQNQRQFVRK